ncbi:MAG: MFS transporter [Gemmatimonadetes bacterium]|nr:MFS transporter [Gemmatimonadota bacterium]
MATVMEQPTAIDELTPTQRKEQVQRSMIAAAVGTSIEWYDFFLYNVAAALVFPAAFFPNSDPYVGMLLSFGGNLVGFVARPVGAVIFGHYGDRMGRKLAMIVSLGLMGGATIAMGLLPTYATLGFLAPMLLMILRVMQGIGVGGNWGASVLLAGEWSDPKKRGFATSWAQFGAPAGMLLANGALLMMTLFTNNEQFMAWGWRIPFLLSFVLILIGLYIRKKIEETPVFRNLKKKGMIAKLPVLEVFKHNWREVILTALLRTGQQVPFYIFTTYVLAYAVTTLGFPRATILTFVMIQSFISMCTIPLMGAWSDKIGRPKITAIGCVIMMIFPFIYFGMLDTKSLPLVALAIILGLPMQDFQYGPQAAYISEAFPGSRRASGASLGYQLASITAGGPAPLIAVALYRNYQTSMAVATYVAICAVISLICVWLLKTQHAAEH